jgi:hypothetical protein
MFSSEKLINYLSLSEYSSGKYLKTQDESSLYPVKKLRVDELLAAGYWLLAVGIYSRRTS